MLSKYDNWQSYNSEFAKNTHLYCGMEYTFSVLLESVKTEECLKKNLYLPSSNYDAWDKNYLN